MRGLFLEKIKKGLVLSMHFKKIISDGRKTNKVWVDQGTEFYNNNFKKFLKINKIEIYSRYSK